MATEMTAPAPDSVQCPVCFKGFTPVTINTHLDVCLLKGPDGTTPSATDDNGPPVKKSRINAAEAVNSSSSSSSSTMIGTQSSAMFSLFQPNKGKVSAQGERSGLLSGKQSPVRAVNKGVKRSLTEAAAGERSAQSADVSDGHTVKAANGLSLQTLFTLDKPLAEILRPNTLEEYFGQNKVVGQQTLLRSLLDSQEVPSLILWGPPGCGKVWSSSYSQLINMQ